jgi:hypothetical protein
MKKLLILLFSIISIAVIAQPGSLSQSVYRSRVNDSTTVVGSTSSGYGYFFWNNQASNPHWDFWNGSAIEHITTFAGGVGGSFWPLSGTANATGAIDIQGGGAHGLSIANFTTIDLDADGDFGINAGDEVDISSGGSTEFISGSFLGFNSTGRTYIIAVGGEIHLEADTLDLNGLSEGMRINGDFGTAGQVLQSNGAGVAPTWEDATGGAGTVQSVTGDGVDNADPANPVIDLSAYLLGTITYNPQSDNYAFVEGDFAGNIEVQLTGTVAKNFTINALSGVGVGKTVFIRRMGVSATALITIVAGSGQTVTSSRGTLTDPGQFVLMALTKTATDTWHLDNGVSFTISSADVTGALGYTPVTNARTIAGLDLTTNRTATEVKTALNEWIKVVTDETTAVTSTSFSNIADLSFTIPSGTEYEIRSVIYYSSGNTSEGASIGINGPTLTTLNYNTRRTTSATASSERWGTTAYDTDVASVTSLAAGNVSYGHARLITSASGTVNMRLACETGAFTITVQAGSYIEYRPLTSTP